MIITKAKKKALILSSVIALFVFLICLIIFIQSEFYNKTQSGAEIIVPQKIIYLSSNKDVSEIFMYDIKSSTSDSIYSDSDNSYKIVNIAYFDWSKKIMIVSQARTGFQTEKLTKINLDSKTETVINNSFNGLDTASNSDGTTYWSFFNTNKDIQLMQLVNNELKLVKKFPQIPDQLLISDDAIAIKTKDTDILIIGENEKTIKDTGFSTMTTSQNNKIIFNRDESIYSYEYRSGKESLLKKVAQKPIGIFEKSNCITTIFDNTSEDENVVNAKLYCDKKTEDLKIKSLLILDYVY